MIDIAIQIVMKKSLALTVFLVAFGSLVGSAAAAPSISGTVKDFDAGTGVAGVKACAEQRSSSNEKCSAVTGADGKYKIEGLFDGAEYEVVFLPEPGTGYLIQFYKEHDLAPAFPEYIEAVAGDVPNIDAKLKKGGTIKGQVTDAVTHAGIEDAEVCISKFPNGSESCFEAGTGGNYTSPTLTPGQYTVAFQGSDGSDYLRIYYDDQVSFEDAEPVTVTAGGTKTGVDAALSKGSSIAGTVTDAGGGAQLEAIDVCLYDAVSGDNVGECKSTNSFGVYKFSALPLGQYKVGFSEEPDPIFKDGFDTQFYEDKATFADATSVQIAVAGPRTGIDAHLHKTPSGGGDNPGSGGGGSGSGGGALAAAPAIPLAVTPTLAPKKLTCKKGFRKKTVKGKAKCTKIKKKHHKR